MARRKKREPSGRRMRCDVGSAGAVRTARPSRNHSISGEGDPRALHPRVTGSFLVDETVLPGSRQMRLYTVRHPLCPDDLF